MNTPTHLIAGTALALPLVLAEAVSPRQGLAMVAWSALIDLDHLPYFAYRARSLSPRKWIPVHHQLYQAMQPAPYLFHTVEVNLLLVLLATRYPWLGWLLLASALHLGLDIFAHTRYHRSLKWIRRWSLLWCWRRR